MVYAIQGELAFNTAARRNTILAAIQNRIAARPRWGIDVLEARDLKIGANGILLELRFNAPSDRDDLSTFVQSQATGPNAPVAGSWLSIHPCPHDEDQGACVATVARTW